MVELFLPKNGSLIDDIAYLADKSYLENTKMYEVFSQERCWCLLVFKKDAKQCFGVTKFDRTDTAA